MDGWTITLLLALADYLERIQHALSDIPGHLRWLADGTDLVGLLGVAARPIETSPPPAPVVRPVGSQAARGAEEIRADIALRFSVPDFVTWQVVMDRLARDVPSLLARLEAIEALALAAKASVPHAPYTGVSWAAVLAALAGSGPTPEPACEHGQTTAHYIPVDWIASPAGCPGPTDDERPRETVNDCLDTWEAMDAAELRADDERPATGAQR